jgi:activator of HSP90 ATPase
MPQRDSFVITSILQVKSDLLYRAFLDSETHSDFTGSPAQIEDRIGGAFTAWDGYISGTIIGLEESRSIKQRWRTTDFNDDDEDSLVEIDFIEEQGHTTVVLKHSNLPEGTGEDYRQGWEDFYLTPLKEYFEKRL